MILKKILPILFFLIVTSGLRAQTFPEKPNQLVNDYTNTLSADEIAALEQKLVAFDDSSSTQIAVVLIRSLEGYDVADYAVRLAETWGIGREGRNNGVLLLASLGDRRVTIQTGYGVEGALPDAITKRIITNEITPYFKQGNYFQGLNQGTDAIIAYTKGEYKNDQPRKLKEKGSSLGFIILIVILVIIFLGKRGGGGGGTVISGRGAASPFWWMLMGSGMGHRHRGGGWGGFSGGGGGWGGGSGGGGGFGGFGGGSFGGGGSSGSW